MGQVFRKGEGASAVMHGSCIGMYIEPTITNNIRDMDIDKPSINPDKIKHKKRRCIFCSNH